MSMPSPDRLSEMPGRQSPRRLERPSLPNLPSRGQRLVELRWGLLLGAGSTWAKTGAGVAIDVWPRASCDPERNAGTERGRRVCVPQVVEPPGREADLTNWPWKGSLGSAGPSARGGRDLRRGPSVVTTYCRVDHPVARKVHACASIESDKRSRPRPRRPLDPGA
jgi:hypothetical protein